MTAGSYRPTEAKYKGGADEMYVTYDLDQRTRGARHADFPKVKRVYIVGDVKDWKPGVFQNKVGREVHGIRIEYEQRRSGYRRSGFTASRGRRDYTVAAASIKPTTQHFVEHSGEPLSAASLRIKVKAQHLLPWVAAAVFAAALDADAPIANHFTSTS